MNDTYRGLKTRKQCDGVFPKGRGDSVNSANSYMMWQITEAPSYLGKTLIRLIRKRYILHFTFLFKQNAQEGKKLRSRYHTYAQN